MVLRNENGLSSFTKGRLTRHCCGIWRSLCLLGMFKRIEVGFSAEYVSIFQNAWEARTQQRIVLQPFLTLPLGFFLVSRKVHAHQTKLYYTALQRPVPQMWRYTKHAVCIEELSHIRAGQLK